MRRSRSSQDVRSRRRQLLTYGLWFGAFVLFVNALVGDLGYLSTMRAGHQYAATVDAVDKLKEENARIEEQIRLLREDPAALEEKARRDLNLIRPGEILIIIKDAKPAPVPPADGR